MLFSVLCLLLSLLASAAAAGTCGIGESFSLAPFASHSCCSSGTVNSWQYSVNGGANDDAILYQVETTVNTYYPSSVCDVKGRYSCTGNGCLSGAQNNCQSTGNIGTATALCLVIRCNNYLTYCDLNSYTVSFTTVLPAPSAVDCVVGSWASWSSCSATCGTGSMSRSRAITTQPANGGAACPSTTQTSSCSLATCPSAVDCVIGSWTSWSACTASCNGGTTTRTRPITTEAQNGGAACPATNQLAYCNTVSCSVQATTGCQCTCCIGNFCTATYIGVASSISSSGCDQAGCYSAFPSSCPAPGTSGSSLASWYNAPAPAASPTPTAPKTNATAPPLPEQSAAFIPCPQYIALAAAIFLHTLTLF